MRAVTTFQAANFYFWGKIPFCRYPLQFWKVKQSSEECRYPATALGGLTLRLHGARQDKSSQGRVGERDAGGGSCVALITEMKCCRRAAASPFSGWGMWEATASMRMVPLHHEVPLHQMRRRCCPRGKVTTFCIRTRLALKPLGRQRGEMVGKFARGFLFLC